MKPEAAKAVRETAGWTTRWVEFLGLRRSIVGLLSMAVLVGAWLWAIHPAVNRLGAFAFGLGGTVWFARRGRDLGSDSGGASVADGDRV